MSEEFFSEQPRDYGDIANADEGLFQLAQAQTDEAAMEIEAGLLIETDQIVDPAEQVEDLEEPAL